MNLFATSDDPVESALSLPDKLVIKIALESCQILCTVAQERGFKSPYKATHKNHPITNWVRQDINNFYWALIYGLELCQEYTFRYKDKHGYERRHKCESYLWDILYWLGYVASDIEDLQRSSIQNHTTFVMAMPEEFKCANPVAAYKRYLQEKKSYYATWRNTRKPSWWLEETKA